MKPVQRFHLLVSTATVVIMYYVLLKLLPGVAAWADSLPIAKIGAGLLGSLGLYTALSKLLNLLFSRLRFVKRLLLGAEYMEGTWIGYFVGHGGERRYVVETFEQTLSSLVIRGRSYTAAEDAHGQWNSEAAHIDVEKGRLIYTYSCSVLSRKINLDGIGVFQLERASKERPPRAIRGYVADLIDGVRLEVAQEKVSEEPLEFDEGLAKAKEVLAARTVGESPARTDKRKRRASHITPRSTGRPTH